MSSDIICVCDKNTSIEIGGCVVIIHVGLAVTDGPRCSGEVPGCVNKSRVAGHYWNRCIHGRKACCRHGNPGRGYRIARVGFDIAYGSDAVRLTKLEVCTVGINLRIQEVEVCQ